MQYAFAHAIDSAIRFTSNSCTSIRIDTQPTDMVAVGSKSQMTQVLVNLIQNAAQALSEKENDASIVIATELEKELVKLTIQDNGCGISEENLKRVFEPFFTTAGVGQGMGLGLSICHTIINNMGGSINIESRQGTGTTITIRLPQA